MELGDEVLKRIAQELVEVVRSNATVDWDKKEQVRASLRRHIRRLLTKYRYPPDKQESAVQLVMHLEAIVELLTEARSLGSLLSGNDHSHRQAP